MENPQRDKRAFLHQSDGLDFGPVPSDFRRNCKARVWQSTSIGPCQPSLKLWISSQVSSSWGHREASEFKVSGCVPGDSDSRSALHWILWGHKRQPGSKSGTWVSLLIIPHPCKSHSWLKSTCHFISPYQWIKLDPLWFILVCRATKGREWKYRGDFSSTILYQNNPRSAKAWGLLFNGLFLCIYFYTCDLFHFEK